MVLCDANNNDGERSYPPSEIIAKTPLIQNDLRNNNCHGLSYLPTPPLPRFPSYPSLPVVPPFHSSSILERNDASKSNSVSNDGTTISHTILSSMPVLPPPHFSCHGPPPVVPPFNSSVSEPINTSSSPPRNEPDPSSLQVLPPPHHSHLPTQVIPPPHHSHQSPPPIIPPFYTSKDDTNHPSMSNSNPSSTHTPTTVGHPYSFRYYQPEIRSFHPPSCVVRSMNSFPSTHSRASSSNSVLPSIVKSSAGNYSTTPTKTMSPFHTPGAVDPSTYSEASSLTSSHQTTGTSAGDYTGASKTSLQTWNDQHLMTTNNSNLSSYDMIGVMNGKPPDVLFLPNDFLPAKKKLIDERHGYKIWTYAVHFDRSLPDKNPDDFQMQSFLTKIMHFYEEIYDNLTRCLLSHLMVG